MASSGADLSPQQVLEALGRERMRSREADYGELEEDLHVDSLLDKDADQLVEAEMESEFSTKRRRKRSKNWSEDETCRLLELRRAVVQRKYPKGSEAWKQIAQQLSVDYPARTWKQVAEKWDTLRRSYTQFIDEEQKQCKAENVQKWHELIAEGKPGKSRRDRQNSRNFQDLSGHQAPAPPDLSSIPSADTAAKFSGISAVDDLIRNVDYLVGGGLDVIPQGWNEKHTHLEIPWDRYGRSDTVREETGFNVERDSCRRKIVTAIQSVSTAVQSVSTATTSDSILLEVDKNDWLILQRTLLALSQKYQVTPAPSLRGQEDVQASPKMEPFKRTAPNAKSSISAFEDMMNKCTEKFITTSLHLHMRLVEKLGPNPSPSLSEKTMKKESGQQSRTARKAKSLACPSELSPFAESSDSESLLHMSSMSKTDSRSPSWSTSNLKAPGEVQDLHPQHMQLHSGVGQLAHPLPAVAEFSKMDPFRNVSSTEKAWKDYVCNAGLHESRPQHEIVNSVAAIPKTPLNWKLPPHMAGTVAFSWDRIVNW